MTESYVYCTEFASQHTELVTKLWECSVAPKCDIFGKWLPLAVLYCIVKFPLYLSKTSLKRELLGLEMQLAAKIGHFLLMRRLEILLVTSTMTTKTMKTTTTTLMTKMKISFAPTHLLVLKLDVCSQQ